MIPQQLQQLKLDLLGLKVFLMEEPKS